MLILAAAVYGMAEVQSHGIGIADMLNDTII